MARAKKMKKSDFAIVEATWRALSHANGWDREMPKHLQACVCADLANEPTMVTYYREQLEKEWEANEPDEQNQH
jgi:hypothetical protein